jgi:hypothetical protein
MMYFNIVFLGAMAGNEETKNKANRFSALLPVSIRTVALSRLPIWMGYWFVLVVLLLLSSLIARGGSLREGYVRALVAYSAGMIGWISFIDINFNLRFVLRRRWAAWLLRGAAVFLSAMFAVIAAVCIPPIPDLGGVGEFLERTLASPFGSAVFLLVSLAAAVFSVFVYTRRRSFIR